MHIEAIHYLIQNKKYKEAEKAIKDLLAQDVNNGAYWLFLGEIYINQERFEEGSETVSKAIELNPSEDFAYYLKSYALLHLGDKSEAENFIQTALELQPNHEVYYALYAGIKNEQKEYEAALDYADRALAIDAENVSALNARSYSLQKLKRKDEAFESLDFALSEDPNNEYTHANYGWRLLEGGDHQKAMYHFGEALKIDPSLDHAQQGLLECIKAKNPIYKWFLQFGFWFTNLSSNHKWFFIIGLYLASRLLNSVADTNETTKLYVGPIAALVAIFFVLTWIIVPLSNLFLRFNKYGNLLLSREEKITSNTVSIFLVSSILIALLGWTSELEDLYLVAIGCFALMIPSSMMFHPSKKKNLLLYILFFFGAMFLAGVVTLFSDTDLFMLFFGVLLGGVFIYQFAVNYMIIKEDS